jgi:hypothetical protein
MLLDDRLSLPKLLIAHARTSRQFDGRIQPELRLAVSANDVNVYSRLFAGKEEEAVSALSMNRR